jgi:hypothetical protein
LVLASGGSSVAIDRKNVVRVTITGRHKRWRNMAIGMGIGAAAGALVGVTAIDEDTWMRGAGIGFSAVLGFGAGAGVGVAIPSHPTVYRAQKP